VINTKSIPMFN